MTETSLDRDWLAAHSLPVHEAGTDKNSRGRVLLAGGGRFVPGALRLTGEAALRAGAGKLQMATVAEAAMPLGVLVPEAAMIALPGDNAGEIGAEAVPAIEGAMARCDAFILGPGMSEGPSSVALVKALLSGTREGLSIVLDAAAIGACADLAEEVRGHAGRAVLTPHHGEMAALSGHSVDHIAAHDVAVATEIAGRYGAVVALKGTTTVIASPGGAILRFDGGGVGLATGGSGDVLAGLIGGLLARGADPLTATGWGVWLHGQAGKLVGETLGPIGFLARDLLGAIPRLMAFSKPKPSIGFG